MNLIFIFHTVFTAFATFFLLLNLLLGTLILNCHRFLFFNFHLVCKILKRRNFGIFFGILIWLFVNFLFLIDADLRSGEHDKSVSIFIYDFALLNLQFEICVLQDTLDCIIVQLIN